MKSAILAVGTEITDGTISNSNAAWISKKLKSHGLVTEKHLSVPDDRPLILAALKNVATDADLIFITGGLGPTSDDFTREIVAEWMNKKLVFDNDTWSYISERLSSRGYQVREIQKQQCYFPENAQILFNSQGTAHGFFCEFGNKKVFVLPGPPNEIAAIWADSIESWLTKETQHLDGYITRLWDTMGLGESDIADIVENIFKTQKYLIGYRVHMPYVEVKISYWKSEEQTAAKKILELDTALKDYTITRDGKDIAQALLQKLEGFEKFSICDEVTEANLLARVVPLLKQSSKKMNWEFSTDSRFTKITDFQISLQISAINEHEFELTMKQQDRIEKIKVSTPYKTENMSARRKQYVAELALIKWLQFLV